MKKHEQKDLKINAKSLISCIVFILMATISFAQNPIFSQRYTADPTGLEYNGRVYIWASHDIDGQTSYKMNDITCMSSADMVNWTDHGEVFKTPGDASWATNAWAPSVVYRNNKFYMYFGDASRSIGVAVSNSPTGPFVDAKGSALITKSTPGANVSWVFDPSVFIDDDGQAYCVFGGGNNGGDNARIIKLNNDTISTDGAAVSVPTEGFFEGAYLNKRTVNGVSKYYYSYFRNDGQQGIDYLISDNPMMGWTYGGRVLGQLGATNGGNNLQASIFQFKSKWYMAYHTRKIARDRGVDDLRQRSVSVDDLFFTDDYKMKKVVPTLTGVDNVGYVNPYIKNEAETMALQSYLLPGIETDWLSGTTGDRMVTEINNGDWIKIRNVNFGDGATSFSASIASVANGGSIQVLLDSETGTLAGTCTVPVTGSNDSWQTVNTTLTGATGVHDVYLKFVGVPSGFLFNFNWWQCTLISRGQSPYTELAQIPDIIEVENYDVGGEAIAYHDTDATNSGGAYRTDGVDIIEKTSGQFVLTDTENGEWLEYSVYVDKRAIYACDIQYTAATSNSKIGGELNDAGTVLFSNVSLPQTANTTDFEIETVEDILLEKGIFKFRINIEEKGCEIDKLEFRFVSDAPPPQLPYNNIVKQLPGIIEAAFYDKGGEGIGYHDADAANQGNRFRLAEGVDIGIVNAEARFYIGWAEDGEWQEYTAEVTEDGVYDVDVVYSSDVNTGVLGAELMGSNAQLLFNDLNLPNTGSLSNYVTLTKSNINLNQGTYVLRINTIKGGFNWDDIEFKKTGALSVDDIVFNNKLKVYPVPSEDGHFNLSETCQWEVYSILGVKISEGESNTIDISSVSKGIYFLKTNYGTKRLLFK